MESFHGSNHNKITESNIEKSNELVPVKNGIDFIFEEKPELGSVGTKEKYAEYLATIFPHSQVSSKIFQHQTTGKFDQFSNDKLSSGRLGYGHYFSDFGNNYLDVDGKPEWSKKVVVLDIKNPKHFKGGDFTKHVYSVMDQEGLNIDDSDLRIKIQKRYSEELKKEYDALIGDKNGKLNSETLVFYQSQIHVLGSDLDIEKFKKFIKDSNTN